MSTIHNPHHHCIPRFSLLTVTVQYLPNPCGPCCNRISYPSLRPPSLCFRSPYGIHDHLPKARPCIDCHSIWHLLPIIRPDHRVLFQKVTGAVCHCRYLMASPLILMLVTLNFRLKLDMILFDGRLAEHRFPMTPYGWLPYVHRLKRLAHDAKVLEAKSDRPHASVIVRPRHFM